MTKSELELKIAELKGKQGFINSGFCGEALHRYPRPLDGNLAMELLEDGRFTVLPYSKDDKVIYQVGHHWMNGTVLCFASGAAHSADLKEAIALAYIAWKESQ